MQQLASALAKHLPCSDVPPLTQFFDMYIFECRADSSDVIPEAIIAVERLVDAVQIATQDASAAAVAAIQQTEQQRKAAAK